MQLVKVNGYISGEVTHPFSLLPPFSMGSTLKGMNLLLEEQILSCKGRPLFQKSVSLSMETN